MMSRIAGVMVYFFNDTAPTEIYTLSLHDALPVSPALEVKTNRGVVWNCDATASLGKVGGGIVARHVLPLGHDSWNTADRKSTRLNSSHANISYAVFCLKKKILHFADVFVLGHHSL